MSDRPSPEEMLARAAAEEARAGRGRLKVFFGAAPGVGKTYAMLEAGLRRRADGVDVVIGWVETHGRAETEALAAPLERLPPAERPYRGRVLPEFDLDAALARRPALLLVDELPHTNVEGSRHLKRWQDVEELVEAGIDVYTTLNVQHLESLNDVVAQVTGVVVRETVPDSVFTGADEIEVVDLPPGDLLTRLKEGKVYRGDAAERAADGFFQEGNLIALRELALRRSAERIETQVEAWRRDHGVEEAWNLGGRLLVAVGPAPSARDLVRVAYRMATRLHVPWIAAAVENARTDRLPAVDRQRLRANLAFAEQLGAEAVVLRGESVADELVALCRQRNVGRIVLGRPTRFRLGDRVHGSLVEALIRRAADIDVLVTSGIVDPTETRRPLLVDPAVGRWPQWVEALGWVAAASATGILLRDTLSLVDLAMLHLLAVVIAASRVPRGPALLAALASVAAFDFFFVPPYFTFAVADLRYLLTFAVMLGVGVFVARLTSRIRQQAEDAHQRERRTASLYALSRELAQQDDPQGIGATAVRHLGEQLGADAVVWLRTAETLARLAPAESALADPPRELAVAQWVAAHGRPAGAGTDTLPSGEALHLPLIGSSGPLGVLAVRAADWSADQRLLLDTFARQIALALERALLAREAEGARMSAETERLRNELLSAVSHDLRTPLASITGSATALLAQPELAVEARTELLDTIRGQGEHLSRLVAGLLDLTRIESGQMRAELEWVPVDEVVDAATARLAGDHLLRVDLPEDVVSAPMDATLMVQVLVNLLENAVKFSPPGAPIELAVRADGRQLRFEVSDRGPGIPEGEEERIFEKFYRIADGRRVPGTGLGLAICRAVVRAHGGRIRAEAREGGGARFVVELPLAGGAA